MRNQYETVTFLAGNVTSEITILPTSPLSYPAIYEIMRRTLPAGSTIIYSRNRGVGVLAKITWGQREEKILTPEKYNFGNITALIQ